MKESNYDGRGTVSDAVAQNPRKLLLSCSYHELYSITYILNLFSYLNINFASQSIYNIDEGR